MIPQPNLPRLLHLNLVQSADSSQISPLPGRARARKGGRTHPKLGQVLRGGVAAVNTYTLALAEYAANNSKDKTRQMLKKIKKKASQIYVLSQLEKTDKFNPADETTNSAGRANLILQGAMLGVPFKGNG